MRSTQSTIYALWDLAKLNGRSLSTATMKKVTVCMTKSMARPAISAAKRQWASVRVAPAARVFKEYFVGTVFICVMERM